MGDEHRETLTAAVEVATEQLASAAWTLSSRVPPDPDHKEQVRALHNMPVRPDIAVAGPAMPPIIIDPEVVYGLGIKNLSKRLAENDPPDQIQVERVAEAAQRAIEKVMQEEAEGGVFEFGYSEGNVSSIDQMHEHVEAAKRGEREPGDQDTA
jgi:hypothetical protein